MLEPNEFIYKGDEVKTNWDKDFFPCLALIGRRYTKEDKEKGILIRRPC